MAISQYQIVLLGGGILIYLLYSIRQQYHKEIAANRMRRLLAQRGVPLRSSEKPINTGSRCNGDDMGLKHNPLSVDVFTTKDGRKYRIVVGYPSPIISKHGNTTSSLHGSLTDIIERDVNVYVAAEKPSMSRDFYGNGNMSTYFVMHMNEREEVPSIPMDNRYFGQPNGRDAFTYIRIL